MIEYLKTSMIKAARKMAAINTFLLMGIVYYLIITPYAVITRLMGKDWLDEGLHGDDSYWIMKVPTNNPESYKRQF